MNSKIWYKMKRLGVYGTVRVILRKLHILPFDSDMYLQKHYYEKLPESRYEKELGEWYAYKTGRALSAIQSPALFNDKIQWLKLHDNTLTREVCSDKYRVREYIQKQNVEGLQLIPLLGAWESAETVDFSQLPDSFVLKQSVGCKMNLVIENKNSMDEAAVREKLSYWMKKTYGYQGMELQYLHSPKKIIAEKYMQELSGTLYDYKIFCFSGKPTYIEVIGDRNLSEDTGFVAFMDTDWNQLDFRTLTYTKYSTPPSKPKNLDAMLRIAAELSRPFVFVRVDLYNIDGEVFFGEMTFTPTNGLAVWAPPEAEKMLGDQMDLSLLD